MAKILCIRAIQTLPVAATATGDFQNCYNRRAMIVTQTFIPMLSSHVIIAPRFAGYSASMNALSPKLYELQVSGDLPVTAGMPAAF
ncbi:hypothetical protein [Chelativorans composti]|uniref:Uncharacterized protein n=1 Tax=Chelativorans composti TaxID=768533 RepID=A0ABW5DMN9_9HYPH